MALRRAPSGTGIASSTPGNTALFREILTYMLEDPRQISAATQMLFMARTIERIGDRATNIAEIVLYLVSGTPVEEERPKADATKSMMLSEPSPRPAAFRWQ